jgi:hypothetical protein
MRIPRQNGRQQKTMSTTHIDYGMDAVKTVGLGNGGAVNRGKLAVQHLISANLVPQ